MKIKQLLIFFWLTTFFLSCFVLKNLFKANNQNLALVDSLPINISECNESSSRNSCTRKLAISDLSQYSFTDILEALEIIQAKDTPYQFHDYLHFLSMEKYFISQNLAEVFIECTPVYFNACYHGVVIGLLSSLSSSPESLEFKEKMQSACDIFIEKNQQGFLEQCIHGVGHAIMVAKNYELFDSLLLCDELNIQKSTCYGGVFMENFPQSSSTDLPSKYLPTTSDKLYPCNKLATNFQEQCYIFLTIYHNHIGHGNWTETSKFCQNIPESAQDECFGAIGSSVMPNAENILQLKDICNVVNGTSKQKLFCYLGIVSAFDDKFGGQNAALIQAVDFCTTLQSEYQPYCFERVSWVFTRWLSISDHLNACKVVESEENKKICSERVKISN